MDSSFYKVNSDEVASKALQGEVLIINLHNGTYYSLEGPACLAWVVLAQGCSLSTCVQVLGQRWGLLAPELEPQLQSWIATLLDARILLVADAPNGEPEFVIEDHGDSLGELPPHFNGLHLTVFDDMGDLLALDPPMPKLSAT